MSVAALKCILWLAIAIALALFFATASVAFDRYESLGLILGGCALIVAASLWYRRALPAAEARKEARQGQQRTTLKQQLTLTNEPVVVKGSSGMLVVVLLAAVAIVGVRRAFERPDVLAIGMVLVMIALTVGLALVFAPRVGKPALTIRRDGLEDPVFGFFRWEEIESVGLQSYTSRGMTTHSLDCYVPNLRERQERLHPLMRKARRLLLRRAGGSFVVINLALPSVPAPVVHALCYELWNERTGRTRTWTSALSQRDIDELHRGDDQLEALKRAGDMAESDPAEAMKLLDDMQKRFGNPPASQEPRRRLSKAAAARRDALIAELRTIDARDPTARKKVLDKHAKAYTRALWTKLTGVLVVLAALFAAWVVLSK
jgi:hypothetical protein